MMDIFADIKPQPRLYIADVTVKALYKVRKNSKHKEVITLNLISIPITLNNKEPPTKRYKDKFLRRIHETQIGKGIFRNMNVRITKIENIRFSSNLAYTFDYDKH